MLKNIKYFFFLAWNWNLRIALHIIKEERRGEKKYNINSIGADDLKHLQKLDVDIAHATLYMPASYDVLQIFLEKAGTKNSCHFLDIGCGKGRVLVVAAAMGAAKCIGIELSKKLLVQAQKNIESTVVPQAREKIKLINQDAYYYEIPHDVDFIFLFNPFDDFVMEKVVENIEESLHEYPRAITIIYLNPLQKHLFLNAGYKQSFHWEKMKYLEGVILQK